MVRRLPVIIGLIAVVVAAPAMARPTVREDTGPSKALERELGDHVGGISSFAVDAAQRFLVSGSSDGTVRVWDAATLSQLQVLRPPLEDGGRAGIKRVAISPDGVHIVVGTAARTAEKDRSSPRIYVFDRVSGRLSRELTWTHKNITDLEFSPDGTTLIVACGGDIGWSFTGFKVDDWTRSFEEFPPPTRAPDRGGDIAFDGTGRMISSDSSCGWCRHSDPRLANLLVYNRRFEKVASIPTQEKIPAVFAPSPDGRVLAVGFGNTAEIELRALPDLSVFHGLKLPGGTSLTKKARRELREALASIPQITSIAWSSDGTTLYASVGTDGHGMVFGWSEGGRGSRKQLAAADSPIVALAPLPGGRLAFATEHRGWGVIDADAQLVRATGSGVIRIEGALELDATGQTVRFRHGPGTDDVAVFSVPDRTLRADAGAHADFSAPKVTPPRGLKVKERGGEISLHDAGPGAKTKRSGSDSMRCLAAVSEMSAVLGGDRTLERVDRGGGGSKRVSIPAQATAINVSRDLNLVVVALADGTIRWYRANDLEELLALAIHPDLKRWVAWTPSGYYDASVGADELFGWRVSTPGREADFFSAGRFRDEYYRPGVVAAVLTTLDEAEAVARASGGGAAPLPKAGGPAQLPPVVTILRPDAIVTSSDPTLTLEVAVRAPSGGAVSGFRVMIDGRPLPDKSVSIKGKAAGPGAPGYSDATVRSITLPLPSSSCTVSVQARSGERWSELAVVRVNRPDKPTVAQTQIDEFDIQPRLYLLAIGVSHYKDPKLKLGYAAKDAHDFAAAMKAQEGRLYRQVNLRTLLDEQANVNSIRDGLEWLERQTTQHDVAVLFIAGHGMNDTTGQYHFMPFEAELGAIKRTMLPDAEIQKTLAVLAGKVLFFFDTCHSGNVLGTTRRGASFETATDGFTNELISAETGAIVFASSSGGQVSQESADWGNGAFTKALVEALGGKADFNRTGRITVKMVDLYLSERVKELTSGTQTPTTGVPAMVRDFPIAVVGR